MNGIQCARQAILSILFILSRLNNRLMFAHPPALC